MTGPVTVSWSLLNTSESIAAAPGEMQATTGGDEFPLPGFEAPLVVVGVSLGALVAFFRRRRL